MPTLGPAEYLHFLHRAWRYRIRTERQELGYVRSLDLAGRTVIDIGAHRGIYSFWLRLAVGPNGRVVSFEPQPEMLAELRQMVGSFRFRNLDVVPAGLSDAPGTATLYRDGDHTGGASLDSRHSDAAAAFEIPVTTLDEYAREHRLDRVALIKCDVEGHERAVFRGGRAILTDHRPRLLFECHDRHARDGGVFEDLKALGYRGWMLDGRTHHPVEQFDAIRDRIDKPYLNFIFEPEECVTLDR
ncbi:MAG: FkbM family methyltransferase [Planctomycetota bacterium]|nr:MAG: FkbM family methyltransferase [Planctomycetota bacterium]